ncbi:Holliday junction resolvase [Zobellia galactanivorans]|uniref:Putative pre-16S rRNA nuclease n=1 Tax=Zobellia galactanivorans (strain DSM 12802 / CCUG 47099 / CIP 106680 / NCIMB 13871 / Dsij) TaxID=63186 RepID=G0LCN4_ZOBGA|nr:Holliday junction resolvase [Zobellia galactanivorans]
MISGFKFTVITIYRLFLQKINERVGRLLALDYGKKRTGIAVTDELQLIASGLTTVPTAGLVDFLKDYVSKEKVDRFIVGEPRQMNNEPSESEALIVPFLNRLAKVFPQIPIERQDERFTSKMAFQTMIDSGLKKKKRRDKALVDEISATIILQAYLNKI